MKVRPLLAAALLAVPAAAPALGSSARAAAQETDVLVVVGIGGQPEYKETFHQWALDLRDALVERHGIAADRVAILAEDPSTAPDRIRDRSTRENLEAAIHEIGGRAGPEDRVLVVLIGHGADTPQGTRFNLPGPDVSGEDLDLMLQTLGERRVAVVNTASASGGFVEPLSAPGRTVLTATRSAGQDNETIFAGFFVDAFREDVADLDKDGRVSLLEAFEFARQGVARHYEENNLLATEHPLLDDNGDGSGSLEPGTDAEDGPLAATFVVGGGTRAAAAVPATDDPVLERLYQERAALEERVAALRAREQTMDAAEYDEALEAVLVELALKNREIRARGGGG